MIYVDDLLPWGKIVKYQNAQASFVGKRHNHMWCHMFADKADCEELHEFAAKLGLKRSWFQGNHYDLVPSKRELALKLGAKPLTRAESVAIWRLQRESK